jgi:glycosyltransferase involved in cell wall biosynthesis
MIPLTLKIVIAGPHGSTGGLEVHTSELELFLVSLGHRVLRINVCNENKTSSPSQNEKIFISNPPGFRGKFVKAVDWLYAFVVIRKFSPDVLISTAIGSGYKWLARFTGSRSFRIVQVVTDDYSVNDPAMLSLIQAYDAVAAQTPILKEQVSVKINPTVPCQVLPCFHQINTNSGSSIIPQSLLGSIRLAYFGRLVGNKGIPLLLDAWRRSHFPPQFILDIWGSGNIKAELEQTIANSPHLYDNVCLKGPYPSGLKYINILSHYHGLVLPSQSTEGLPLVLLEAASVGLPILTTSVGGIPDFARGNPDVVMVDRGLDPLCIGLNKFVGYIQEGSKFNRLRHQSLFLQQYSRHAIESVWLRMLESPSQFF